MPLRISPGITAFIIAMAAVANAVFMYYYIPTWIPPESPVLQFTRAIVLAWIIMWLYAGALQISKIAGHVWISSVLILLTINCAIDLFCYNIYHIHFTHEFLIAMKDATHMEASDFLSVYMDERFWTYFGIFAVFLSAVYLSFKALTPVNTTNLSYTIMGILGIELDGHPAARSRSFFK